MGLTEQNKNKADTDELPNFLFRTSNIIAQGDINDLKSPGLNGLAQTTALNIPSPERYYIFNIMYQAAYFTQIAIGYDNTRLFIRYYRNGVWSVWAEK